MFRRVKQARKPLLWLTFMSVLREKCLIPDGDSTEELSDRLTISSITRPLVLFLFSGNREL